MGAVTMVTTTYQSCIDACAKKCEMFKEDHCQNLVRYKYKKEKC